MYSQDGYRLIRGDQLLSVLHALNERLISFRAFRVYFACLELLAIREAADRTSRPRGKRQRRFLRSELDALVNTEGEGPSFSRELSSLKQTGLLTFLEGAIEPGENPWVRTASHHLVSGRSLGRLVPVPRQMLKFLAACRRPTLAKTIVAYLLRGLSLERSGKLRSAGTVKVSWICQLCEISERAARAARAELIQLGWITKDVGSFQRKLNRDGAYFVINIAWRRVCKSLAPLSAENCTESAPPIEKQETPIGSKNQKPANYREAGVCKANGGKELSPTLWDIKPEDLRRPARLEILYRQAVKAGWIQHSEANIGNFVCAALRATRAGGRVGAIFAGIVKKNLWHHVTDEQEDQALKVLRRYREANERAFSPPTMDCAVDGNTVISLLGDRYPGKSLSRNPRVFSERNTWKGQQERGPLFQVIRQAMIDEYASGQLAVFKPVV